LRVSFPVPDTAQNEHGKELCVIQVYRFNTGSCGGCDLEVIAALAAAADIDWAATPHEADVLLLTGPLTTDTKKAFMALLQELDHRAPIIAVGRCAIDGHPFGRGGVAVIPNLTVHLSLDGCPPTPVQIVEAIRTIAVDREDGAAGER
jgi:Ni,Fe-hydrogenase III small subunit